MKKNPKKNHNYRHRAYLYLFLVSLIWGAATPVIKYTLAWFDPLTFLSYRMAISMTIGFAVIYSTKGKFIHDPKTILNILIYSLLSITIALGLLFFGLEKTSALTGSLLTLTGPLFLIAGGSVIFRDRITHKEKTGIFITLLGVAIILYESTTKEQLGSILGNLLVIGCMISDKISILLAKHVLKHKVNPLVLTQSSFIIGFFTLLPMALTQNSFSGMIGKITSAPYNAHLGVWFMAIFSGTIAYTIYNISIKSIEISEAALFTYFQPLWSVLLAVFWLGDKFTYIHLISGAVIISGIYLAEKK